MNPGALLPAYLDKGRILLWQAWWRNKPTKCSFPRRKWKNLHWASTLGRYFRQGGVVELSMSCQRWTTATLWLWRPHFLNNSIGAWGGCGHMRPYLLHYTSERCLADTCCRHTAGEGSTTFPTASWKHNKKVRNVKLSIELWIKMAFKCTKYPTVIYWDLWLVTLELLASAFMMYLHPLLPS